MQLLQMMSEWSGSEDGEDGHDDDDGPPSPEDAMHDDWTQTEMATCLGDEFVTYPN